MFIKKTMQKGKTTYSTWSCTGDCINTPKQAQEPKQCFLKTTTNKEKV
jgi:hypothetical protein